MAILVAGATGCLAGDVGPQQRDLTGLWKLNPDKSEIHGDKPASLTAVIETKEGSIQITETEKASDGKETVSEIKCGTVGTECKTKIDGQPATVRFWYNGPKLVEMVLKGKNGEQASKIRRSLSPDGSTLTVEIMPIAPAGQANEKLIFEKQPSDKQQTASTTAR